VVPVGQAAAAAVLDLPFQKTVLAAAVPLAVSAVQSQPKLLSQGYGK